MALVAVGAGVRLLARRLVREGAAALAGPAAVVCALAAMAGAALVIAPDMDHHWLDWLETAAPGIELGFLTAQERQAYHDARSDMERRRAEHARLQTLAEDVRWGTREMTSENQERLRQFLAGDAEIRGGDRMVLHTLRSRARERQRYALGVPVAAVGALAAIGLARIGRRRARSSA